MKKAIVWSAFALIGASIAAPGWADSSTSPGTNSVHVSTIAVAVPFQQETEILTGTIKSGKHGRVVVLQAMVGSLSPDQNVSMRPLINGVGFEPTDDFGNGGNAGLHCPSTATFTCTTTGSWWIDLDAAEVAHPGQFIGKPLVIKLLAGTNDLGGIGIVANMSARLEKK